METKYPNMQTRPLKRQPLRSRIIHLGLWAVALIAIAFGVAVLVLEHKPGWYVPVTLTEAQLREERLQAMRVVDDVGDRLVAGAPFEITLSQDQVNKWLTGLEQIWPDAARQIPTQVIEPVVAFEPGLIRSGARIESDGWRAIASCGYQFEVSNDKLRVTARMSSAHCGAMPIPDFLISRLLQSEAPPTALRSTDPAAWFSRLEWENRFVWPNGRRPFRIDDVALEKGQVRLKIRPL